MLFIDSLERLYESEMLPPFRLSVILHDLQLRCWHHRLLVIDKILSLSAGLLDLYCIVNA